VSSAAAMVGLTGCMVSSCPLLLLGVCSPAEKKSASSSSDSPAVTSTTVSSPSVDSGAGESASAQSLALDEKGL